MAASPKLQRLAIRIGFGLRLSVCLLCLCGLASIAWGSTQQLSKLDLGLAVLLFAIIALMAWPTERLSKVRVGLTKLAFGCVLAFTPLELYVRLFDPFPILLRGGRIDLPVNVRREFSTNGTMGLDSVVQVSFNSRGFRGPEPPANWNECLTILCVVEVPRNASI